MEKMKVSDMKAILVDKLHDEGWEDFKPSMVSFHKHGKQTKMDDYITDGNVRTSQEYIVIVEDYEDIVFHIIITENTVVDKWQGKYEVDIRDNDIPHDCEYWNTSNDLESLVRSGILSLGYYIGTHF